MSLPLLFGTELASIPAKTPYFFISPEQSFKWHEKFFRPKIAKTLSQNLRIGICWRGSGKYAGQINTRRDLNHESLRFLVERLKNKNIELHALQADLDFRDIKIAADLGLHIHKNDLSDFLETASLINELDGVISIDTAVGHLSGALNKPTYLLIPDPPDFMSLMDREDTPWYPSTTLVRQEISGDWTSAVDKLAKYFK